MLNLNAMKLTACALFQMRTRNRQWHRDSVQNFLVNGPGGSGKTFLYNCIIHSLCADDKMVCPVAWTGIASILLAGGSTSHSLFNRLVPVMQGSVCDISTQSPEAELLRKCSLIIWDEAPMAPKEALYCVDNLLRDVTKYDALSLAAKCYFLLVLPVVSHRGRADQENVCLKNSALWSSFKQLHHIGEWTCPPIPCFPGGYVELPDFLVLLENADICRCSLRRYGIVLLCLYFSDELSMCK
ncbi:hypothetical protein PR048_001320 [Dryococelus australis]|uniref:ATP-dependent DNA helicase n=1 Tax=Dryococelus australis TaxID=614101 RepID=A0ABQ9IH63_9NEOP|nr:hypothetical protein PR048_001320 [Dryococelus australis]